MLNRRLLLCRGSRRRQSGVVLMVALIVLVAMTLAGLALMRSVDTANIIAGNLAFQQAATHSGDSGIEAAISWIENNSALLNNDSANNGYVANGLTAAPAKAAGQTWDAYWLATWSLRATAASNPDGAGNTVQRVIDRLCTQALAPTAGGNCSASPVLSAATATTQEGGEPQPDAPSQVYYRITARVAGPKNTVSFVQAVIAR